jgi:hypothetical protein
MRAKAVAIKSHFSRLCPLLIVLSIEKKVAYLIVLNRYIILKRALRAWMLSKEREVRRLNRLLVFAIPHGNRCNLRYYWKKWMDYLNEVITDREVRLRSEIAWSKVQGWLHMN